MLTVLPHRTFNTRLFGEPDELEGVVTRPTHTDGTVVGTLSAATPSDIALLPEGKRSRQAFKLFTETALPVASTNSYPTWVQVGSDWFEVSNSNPWQNTVISHYEYIITKIENPTEYAS